MWRAGFSYVREPKGHGAERAVRANGDTVLDVRGPKVKLFSPCLPAATLHDTLLVQPLQRLLLQERIVAEACEPMHRGFAPKPGELALRVAACGLLNRGVRLVHRKPVLQDFAQFAITDKVERFRVFG